MEITSGRYKFDKYSKIINILVKIFSVFGKQFNYKLLCLFRNTWGSFGLLFRYIFLKNCALKVGKNIGIKQGVYFFNVNNLILGDNVMINQMSYVEAAGGIEIGNNVAIAHSCTLVSSDHSWDSKSTPIQYNKIKLSKIKINDDVWIGCGVRVLGGANIGNRVVVAAGSVVNRNLDNFSLYAGVPCKKIKNI